MKRQIQSQSRFEAGAQGGCEVRLCEFNEQRSPEPQVVRFAAAGFDECWPGRHWLDPDFEVASVQNFGLILMASGSPELRLVLGNQGRRQRGPEIAWG